MFGRAAQENDWQFAAEGQTEAVHRLLYLVENGEVFSLLTGAWGTGKSTVLAQTARELTAAGRRAVNLNVVSLDCRAALWHLCGALSVISPADADTSELMVLIRDELLARARCQHETVLLLDDTDLAQPDFNVVLNLLASIAEASAGQVSVITSAEHPLSPELHQRSMLSVRLEPLGEHEAIEFAVRRLAHLGVPVERFTDTGWRALADLGAGFPGQLLRICQVLQAVMAVEPGPVDAAVVHGAVQELLSQAA